MSPGSTLGRRSLDCYQRHGEGEHPAAVAATGGAGPPGSVTCGMGREDPPQPSFPGSVTCGMGKEDPPAAVAAAGVPDPRKSRECSRSLHHHRQRPRPIAAVATAAVTVAGVTTRVLAAVIVVAAATPSPPPSSPPPPPTQLQQPQHQTTPQARKQLSQCAARELGSHNRRPEDGELLRGRTRDETARMRHGLLSLMVAREGIGHILFHQAPPDRNPPLPTGERAVDAELVCRSMCGRVL